MENKKFKETDLIEVTALVPNVYYTCPKTLDSFIWMNIGDVESLTFAQLKRMKAEHLRYFSGKVLAIRDTEAAIALDVDKYQQEAFEKADIELFYGNEVKEAQRKIKLATDSERETIKEKITDDIMRTKIQNAKMIKMIEQEFDLDLLSKIKL